MASSTAAHDVFAREFLTLRSHLIDMAAALDRADRAGEPWRDDARVAQIHQALQILAEPGPGRAEKILREVFSLPYEEAWRGTFNVG